MATAPSSPLTARGVGLVGAALLSALIGAVVGIEELFAVAVAAAGLVVTGWLWARAASGGVVVERRATEERTEAGGTAVITFRVWNRARRASPTLRLWDLVEVGSGAIELTLAPVSGNRTMQGSYRLRTTKRGVFTVGPLVVGTDDPFGLARKFVVQPGTGRLIVHPRVERLSLARSFVAAAGLHSGTVPSPGQDNDEFESLREYRPGDDLRRLHWRSTAKTGSLMVREDQRRHRGQLTLLVDVRPETWRSGGFERGLSAAASIASAAADAKLQVRLVTTSGVDTGIGEGTDHLTAVLDGLATLRVTGERDEGRTQGRRRQDAGGLVVVIGSESTASTLANASGMGRAGGVIPVVFDGDTKHGTHSGGPVVRVGTGGLEAAWNRVMA